MSVAAPAQRDRRPPDPPASSRVPHRRLILAVAAVLVLAAVATWLVAVSTVFGVRTVTVRGASSLRAGRIRTAAQIRSGTPLLRLDTGAVTRRVESLPDVAGVTVRTHYPSTVVITVTQRVAVGYLASAGRYTLVDRTGDQFATTTTKPAGLPLFAVPSGATARRTGQAVATVAASLPRPVLAEVASIQAFDPTAITLLLTDHRVVRWGSAARSAAKARVLPALLRQSATQIDLTDPDQPFTR